MKHKKHETWVYHNGKYEKELVCPEKWMRFIYENPVGSATLPFFVKRKFISSLYGMYCRTPLSARGIPKFVEQYKVDMTGCDGTYKNFADFFAREKKDIAFPSEPYVLGSPCEGLASVYTGIDTEKMIAAKGDFFSLSELFNNKALAYAYEGGSMLRIRLTPTNYHRVHFFDDGAVADSKHINGDLYSVNPLALNRIARIYCRNKRSLIMFSSDNFGDTMMVEVGATFVGSIIHCFEDTGGVRRGQQAGYFQPGGSLLLVFFKKGSFIPGESLLEQSNNGYETKVSIGEALGTNIRGLV